MGNPQVTDTRLAWFAGIVDGEGSVTMGLSKSKGRAWYVPHLSVVNTDPMIIATSSMLLDEIGCRYHLQLRRNFNGHHGKKPIWDIVVHNFNSLHDLLEILIPHLQSIKKAKSQLMLRFLKLRIPKIQTGANGARAYTDEETELFEKIRYLNDFTPDVDETKIKSELQGKLAELAEMTSRLVQ